MSWNCLEQTTSIAFVGHVDWQLFIAHKLQPNEIFFPPSFSQLHEKCVSWHIFA